MLALLSLTLVASSAKATADPCVSIEKKVSVDDGHTFFDADTVSEAPATDGTEASYKVIITNCGNIDLYHIEIEDDVVGFYDWIDGLAPGQHEAFVIWDFPICEPPEPPEKMNTAIVWAKYQLDGQEYRLEEQDPAWVICGGQPFCGDHVIQPPETCDPPGQPAGEPNECRDDCTFCGDGNVDPTEECDDGNNVDGDGCSADCLVENVCGDGHVQPPETCDPPGSVPDTPPGNMNACRDNCTYCGDGIVNDGEECDDPNDPLCTDDCKLLPFCGDGIVDPEANETCDPPGSVPDTPPGNMNACRDNCTYCGDGIVDEDEECDDPNDPLCSNECKLIPFCGDGIVDPEANETCDPPGSVPDTPPGNMNVCRDNCTYCGDGIVNNGEECDDPGNPACTDDCKLRCDIEVTKSCELPPPPPAGDAKCEAKLQEVTVIWNGAGPIDITPGVGIIGTSASSASPGDVITLFTDGSTNDTIIEISGSIVGESTFHISCSDKDMDGWTETNEDQEQVSPLGRDCGKDQGDGKGGSGFINQWLLEGFVDANGDELDCSPDPGDTTTTCDIQSIVADCKYPTDKPEVLTWLYSGGGCGASDNDQVSGDLFCNELDGGISGALPVTIVDNEGNVFDVAPGETFTTSRSASKVFMLSNTGAEENGRHVSCSQPLQAGDVYGSLTLAALNGAGIGSNVVYAYQVSNQGVETVNNISVFDDQLGSIGSIESLAPGESETLTATAFISETTTNVATVDGQFPSGATCGQDSNPVVVNVLPPPPCDVSLGFDKLEDNKIKWTLSNPATSRAATLATLMVVFPPSLGTIKKVRLDGDDIFKKDDSDAFPDGVPSGETIDPDDWTKEDVTKRQVDPDKTVKLEVEFTAKDNSLNPGDFDMLATFEEGCEVEQ